MSAILLDFQFKDILNWVGGLIVFILFFVVCAFIGQLGVQIRSGFNILKYIKKTKTEAKLKGLVLNEKGIALKKKGIQKIMFPTISILVVYCCIYIFVPVKYFFWTLVALVPILLGYFGLILVPEQIGELLED